MNRRSALPLLLAAASLGIAATGTAVAGHATFSDSAGAHEAGIHWLSETGITGGCGGGRFCTEDAVKRGQMATFLHRLSGTAATPPVVNADKVDGLDAEQLRGQQGPAGPAGPQGTQGPPGAAAPTPFAVDRALGPYSVPAVVAPGEPRVLHSEMVDVPRTGFHRLSHRVTLRMTQTPSCDGQWGDDGIMMAVELPAADGSSQPQRVRIGHYGGGEQAYTTVDSGTVWLTAGQRKVDVLFFGATCSTGVESGRVEVSNFVLGLVEDSPLP